MYDIDNKGIGEKTVVTMASALTRGTDEGKPVKEGTVEAWARDAANPVGGYYGLRKGYRGRFASYVPPVLELLGLVELEHTARNNRVRAK